MLGSTLSTRQLAAEFGALDRLPGEEDGTSSSSPSPSEESLPLPPYSSPSSTPSSSTSAVIPAHSSPSSADAAGQTGVAFSAQHRGLSDRQVDMYYAHVDAAMQADEDFDDNFS